MTQNIGRLGVVLGLDTAEFVTGLTKATGQLAQFADKMRPAAAAGVAAFAALTAKAMQYADEMADVAKANDVAIGKVLELGNALQANGGKIENAGKLYSTFAGKIEEAAGGGAKIQKTFADIGVSLSDLKNLSQQDLMEKTIDALGKIDDAQKRNALSAELFGKAVKGVDLQGLSKDMKDMAGQFDDQAAGMEALADVMDTIEKSWSRLMGAFAKSIGSDLKATVDYFANFGEKMSVFGRAIEVIFETIVVLAANVSFVTERLFATAALVMDKQFFLSSEYRKKALEQYKADSERMRKDLDDFEAKVMVNQSNPESKPAPQTQPTKESKSVGRQVTDAYAKELDALKMISTEFRYQQEQRLTGIQLETEMLGMTEREREVAKAVNQVEQERLKVMKDLDAQVAKARAEEKPQRVIDALEAQRTKVNNTAEAYKFLASAATEANVAARDEKQIRVIERISGEFAIQQKQRLEAFDFQTKLIGMSEREAELATRINQIETERLAKLHEIDNQIIAAKEAGKSDEVINALIAQKTAVDDVAEAYKALAAQSLQAKEMQIRQNQLLTNSEKQALGDTVSNLAELGKHSKAAFNAWKAMAIAQAMVDTYTGAIAAFKALAGIPIVGPALGTAAAGIAIATGISRVAMIKNTQYQGREKGGVMTANQPYMVGEKGPEMVIPNKSSMVVPNHSLASAMGQSPQVVYNGPYIANMNAMDTQSAAQFLAKNKDAVYAANFSASRSIPQSR